MQRYKLIGGNGSPYSMKMRALMRYRRLPFDWYMRTPEWREQLAHLKPQLIPVLQLPDDGSYHMDSTFLIQMLEQRHPGERSVIPPDPAQAFLCALIEDIADEWGTKAMFLYRWAREVDQDYCSRWIVHDANPALVGKAYEEAVAGIRVRQIGRMALVGCAPENAPVIEESYHRILSIFKDVVPQRQFLFGGRPSAADFAWFGQLKTLADDPTPMSVMRKEAQIVADWVRWLDDASGCEGEWRDPAKPPRDGVVEMLRLAGDSYFPFLRANAAAAARGEDRLSLEIRGKPYSQAVFGYQIKCLTWLREAYAELPPAARENLAPLLEETACLSTLAA